MAIKISKPGIVGACNASHVLNVFLQRHRQTIIEVVQVLSPSDVTAVNEALVAVTTVTALFAKICALWVADQNSV